MRKMLLTALIAVIIGTSAGYLFPVKRTHAIFGFGDITFDPANLAEMLVEFAQDTLWPVLRDRAIKRIVDDLTDQIIDSIENGGQPLFVQNPLQELKLVGDVTFDTFNNYLESEVGVNLCAPFQAQLSLYFQTTFREQPFGGLPVECTFDQFKQALSDSQHFIEKGGWITFQQAFVPSNNFFGASLLVDQAYMSSVRQKIEQLSDSINRAAGFTDVKRCTRWHNPYSEELIGFAEAQTYGRIIAFGDADHIPLNAEEQKNLDIAMNGFCDHYENVTPGSVVAQAATQGVLKDFQYASNVQSILSALINTALSKVLDSSHGLLEGGSSTRGTSVFSGYQEEGDKVLNEIRDMQLKYAESIRAFGNLISLALRGDYNAHMAVAYCVAKSPDAPGPPKWGTLIYGDSQEVQGRHYAALGDLIDYPHRVIVVDPIKGYPYYTLGSQLPTSTDPYYLSVREGYFTSYLGHRDASGNLLEDGPLYKGKVEAQKNIVLVERIVNLGNAGVDLADLEATTTQEMISQARKEFTSFSQEYQQFVGDILNKQLLSGGEPGSLGGVVTSLAGTLQTVVDGLIQYDLDEDGPLKDKTLNILTGETPEGRLNFFYCSGPGS